MIAAAPRTLLASTRTVLGQATLDVTGLRHQYRNVVALKQADLTVHAGELVALLGPPGSGESTLLAGVAGMLQPTAGSVMLGGHYLLPLPPERRGLGMLFQDYALWPHMRVGANVRFPLDLPLTRLQWTSHTRLTLNRSLRIRSHTAPPTDAA